MNAAAGMSLRRYFICAVDTIRKGWYTESTNITIREWYGGNMKKSKIIKRIKSCYAIIFPKRTHASYLSAKNRGYHLHQMLRIEPKIAIRAIHMNGCRYMTA